MKLPSRRTLSSQLPLPVHLAGYRLSHLTGRRPGLPVNLTISVTFACPSRCLTCGIWQNPVHNLSLDEYVRLFPSFEKVPIWVTLSGGDQFLRSDLDKIVEHVRKDIEPKIINIPMNGVVTGLTFSLLPKIAEVSRGAQLVLNLSADEVGEAHDRIRGVPGNFAKPGALQFMSATSGIGKERIAAVDDHIACSQLRAQIGDNGGRLAAFAVGPDCSRRAGVQGTGGA